MGQKWARTGLRGVLEAQSQHVFEVTFPLWKVGRFRHHVTLTSYQARQAGYTAVASSCFLRLRRILGEGALREGGLESKVSPYWLVRFISD